MSRAARLAALSYALVGILYTWPLALAPSSTFPGHAGDADAHGFLWNNWWIAHALWARHRSPLRTDMIFAPFGADLRLHTLGLLYGVLSSPLLPWLGTIRVLSLQTFLTPVLNGLAAFGLVAKLSGRRDAAFVAGLLIAATPAVNFHIAVGRVACAAVWPLIWAISALIEVLERPSFRSAAILGVAIVTMLLADQQIALYGFLWLTVVAVSALFSGRLSVAACRWLVPAIAIVLAPFIWLYARPFAARGYTVPAAFEASTYSYPISLLWRPALVWRAYGALLPIAFVAGAWQLRRNRRLLVWWIGSALFLVLTFGPAGVVFSLLRQLLGLAQFRTPYRFQMAVAVGFAVVAGALMSTASRRTLAIVTFAAVTDLVAYRVIYSFPLQSMPAEPVYDQIAADPADRLVLEVPVGVRTGTDRIGPGEIFSFYQPQHGKRIINGMVARASLAALDYYRRSPALMFLAHETPPPGDIAADLRQQLRALNVGYVVIHTGGMDPGWCERVLDLLRTIDAERLNTGRPDTIALRVR
jgi:hypothetical protein